MYIEVRKRLGVANIYIANESQNTDNWISTENKAVELQVQKNSCLALTSNNCDGQVISIGNFVWPKNTEDIGTPLECKYKPTLGADDILFRISLQIQDSLNVKNDSIAFLSHSSLLDRLTISNNSSKAACFSSKYDVNDKLLKHNEVGTSVIKDMVAFCYRCKEKLFDMECSRLLPLPSINWKDSSHDWFCGCTHSTNQLPTTKMTDKDHEIKRKLSECHIDGTDGGKKQKTNRNLATASLAPRLGDVLYSNAFLCLNINSLKNSVVKMSSEDCQILNCPYCNGELGFNENVTATNGSTATIWDHSVTVTVDTSLGTKQEKDALSTFRKLISTVLEESGKPFIQIVLQEYGGEKRSLYLWILEQNLCLLVPEKTCGGQDTVLSKKSVMKILFNGNYNAAQGKGMNKLDLITVTAGSDMVNAALNHLNNNSLIIPYSQRYQKQNGNDLTFSYIFNDS